MKLVDSKTFATHILDLNKHFHQLQIDLKHWSSTPDDLTGISVIFPDFPPAKDVVHQALFNVNDTDGEPQEHGDVTIEVISLICTHLYFLDVFNRCIWFEMSYLFHVSKVFLTRSIMFRYRNGFLSLGFIVYS
jgi:hypothetical protein